MKKIFFFAIMLLNFAAFSQISVRAGLNLSNISITSDGASVSYSSKIGFHLGIMDEIAINDNLSWRPGLLFSQRGAKIDILGTTSSVTASYLDIPLSLIYNFSTEDSGLFAELGPNVQYLLSASSEGDDVKDGWNSIDFGLIGGLGYNINNNIGIGVNYNIGLANIIKDAPDGTSGKNSNIGVYLNYSF